MYDVWYYTYATWMWVKHSTHASAEAAWAEARRYRSANFLGQRQVAVTETALRPANTLPGAALQPVVWLRDQAVEPVGEPVADPTYRPLTPVSVTR